MAASSYDKHGQAMDRGPVQHKLFIYGAVSLRRPGLQIDEPPVNPSSWMTVCDTYTVTICRSG